MSAATRPSRLADGVRALLANRLPAASTESLARAFEAAAGGDVARADALLTRARQLAVAEGIGARVAG